MAKTKKTKDPKKLKGMSIYQEEKRTVYAPFFTKKGYLITENNVTAYTSYVQGYLIALLIFSVAYIVTKNFIIGILLGGLFLVGTLIAFYVNFIKKAGTIDNYKRVKKDNFFIRQAKTLPFKNLITVTVSCFLLGLMIMLNGKLNNFEGSYFALNTALAIVAVIYGFMNLYIIIYKKKNNIETEEE